MALVGAGPGHPGLLTLRAVECLRQADLVLYDRLVPVRLLEHASSSARLLCVEELPARHPDRYPQIHQTMIDAARQGLRVVRLKGGDPFLFGRGAEEAEALRAAGVPYEVVPGVTAALGASACAGIPLTHRQHASAVALVTGHEQPDKAESQLDWGALARFPGTLVFYMGIARLPHIVRSLIENGKPADVPAAAVHWGTTSRQRTVEATLEGLPARVAEMGIAAPALVIVGPVVGMREKISWFEDRPLFGKRVLVTRPRHQAADLVRRLEELGASALVLPTVEVLELEDWSAVDRALAELPRCQWLVFTSANGVHALMRRLFAGGRDLRALGHLRLAVIGPATGDALRSYHLMPDAMPAEHNSEGLVAALRPLVTGQRVLLARADRGLDLLREQLSTVAEVEQVAVYRQVDHFLAPADEALESLRRGEVDYATLTSSNIARALILGVGEEVRERMKKGAPGLVTISPRTSAAVRELEMPVAGEAQTYTTEGVLEALCLLARR